MNATTVRSARPDPAREQPRTPASSPSYPPPAASTHDGISTGAPARLCYTGVAEIVVRGPRSGRSYLFGNRAPERLVDGRDVDGLMRMGLFRRLG
jgi:hypothetical protein